MKILKSMISIEGEGNLYECDTIQYEGKLWIVPQWLDQPGTGKTMPARIILLDTLPYQKTSFGGCDFLLNQPIPKSVFYEGKVPFERSSQYVVIEKPHIYQGSDSVH